MHFSTSAGKALKALASMPEDGSFSKAEDLATSLDLPAPYLAKILQALAKEEILESNRGPKGGFHLARPAHRITVQDVLTVLDAPASRCACVMGQEQCLGFQTPCPFHQPWVDAQALMDSLSGQVTIRDLCLLGMPVAQV